MYSCNVPVPADISRLARGLATETLTATPRDRHTLVAKRLGDGDAAVLARRLRESLDGLDPFTVHISGVEVFDRPPTGPAPVAYLAVESPALSRLHRRLCSVFDPIVGLEGDEYVPHVTVARGGDADRLAGRAVDDAGWTVESLSLWSATYEESVERFSLPR